MIENKMLFKVFSIIYWIFFVVSALIIFPVYLLLYLVTFFIDRHRKVVHYFTRIWALFYLYVNPLIKFKVENLKIINKDKTYVIISNHQSMLDIFILYILPIHFRWISKIEIFKIPIVGIIMRLNKYIPLERGNKESVDRMYSLAEKSLNEGISIIIFPEGTRSEDGTLKKFKEGAFNLSKNTKKDILMVIIDNAYRILPKNSIFFESWTEIKVRIIGEIPSISEENFDYTIKKIEQLYRDELAKMRGKK